LSFWSSSPWPTAVPLFAMYIKFPRTLLTQNPTGPQYESWGFRGDEYSQVVVLWAITPCSYVGYRRFGGPCCVRIHPEGDRVVLRNVGILPLHCMVSKPRGPRLEPPTIFNFVEVFWLVWEMKLRNCYSFCAVHGRKALKFLTVETCPFDGFQCQPSWPDYVVAFPLLRSI
jgi:hypothetical protein